MTKLQYPLCGLQVCLQRASCGPRAALWHAWAKQYL